MKSSSLISQIAMVALSIGIIFTYVEPTFTTIGEAQDTVVVYQEELQKVSAVNAQLNTFATRMESVSIEDKERLEKYIPEVIDPIVVPRDLLVIIDQSGSTFKDVTGVSSAAKVSSRSRKTQTDEAALIPHSFTVTIESTYQQLKDLLHLLSQNDYPFEIHELKVNQAEGGFLTTSIEVVTYTQN